MMGKGPNGEWGLSQNVGLDSAVTSKAPFWKCPHPGLYPKLIQICFLFCTKFHTVVKVWIFIFVNPTKS